MSDFDFSDSDSPAAVTPKKAPARKTLTVISDSDASGAVAATPGSQRPQRAAASRPALVEVSDSDDASGSEDEEDDASSEEEDSEDSEESAPRPTPTKRAPAKAASPAAKAPRAPAKPKAAAASKPSPAPSAKKGEVLSFKSPAEFFAENQNIAGFDNVSAVPPPSLSPAWLSLSLLYV